MGKVFNKSKLVGLEFDFCEARRPQLSLLMLLLMLLKPLNVERKSVSGYRLYYFIGNAPTKYNVCWHLSKQMNNI